jgi:hypothetical protein
MDPRPFLLTLALPVLLSGAPGAVPAFPDLPGWTRVEPEKRFGPDNLYEYINGASESFLAFTFQELRVAEYARTDKASVVVEAYRHPSPLLAFGIYSQEKPSQGDFGAYGAQGYLAPPILNFVAGETYFKLSAYGGGDTEAQTLKAFALKLAETFPGSRALPSQIACFPGKGKVANSERYQLENVMGYAFLRSAFTADYQVDGKSFQLLLLEGTDAKEAEAALVRLCQTLKQPPPDPKAGRCVLQDPNQGELALAWHGKHLGIAVHLADAKLREQYLASLMANLK